MSLPTPVGEPTLRLNGSKRWGLYELFSSTGTWPRGRTPDAAI